MDDIERLRRWIEDPPELATPQDVLSMLAALTSLTDELQRLRDEYAKLRDWQGDSLGAVVHKDDHGKLTLEWPQGEESVPVSRALVEQMVEQMSEHNQMADELQRLRGEKDDAEAVWTAYGKAQRERAEKAEAENTELRAALERIAGYECNFCQECSGWEIAKAALASHTGDTEGLTITWDPDATEPKIELIPE